MVKEKVLRVITENGKQYEIVQIPCDRCGGAGEADKWKMTGHNCFKCRGSGIHPKSPVRRKLYTPEQQAKRQAAATRRAEKKAAERAAEYERIAALPKEYINEDLPEYQGGVVVCIEKNTYKIKDALKADGFKWMGAYWVKAAQTALQYKMFAMPYEEIPKYEYNEFGKPNTIRRRIDWDGLSQKARIEQLKQN